MLVCDALKATSAPDESEGDFRSRLTLAARERRDAAVADLRRKYAPKLQSMEDRERARAGARVARAIAVVAAEVADGASVGASILGAFLGRKTLSATNVNRAASAARSAGRIGRESGDVDRADESLEVVRQQRAELQRQFETESAALENSLDASAAPLRKVPVSPRKSDIAVGEVALVWLPWRKGADGFPGAGVRLGPLLETGPQKSVCVFRQVPRVWTCLAAIALLSVLALAGLREEARRHARWAHRARHLSRHAEVAGRRVALRSGDRRARASKYVAYLVNGAERVRVPEVTVADGRIDMMMPGYENTLTRVSTAMS